MVRESVPVTRRITLKGWPTFDAPSARRTSTACALPSARVNSLTPRDVHERL